MKTEDLLNLGNYQKLDFVLIAGTSSNTDGIARMRPPTPAERQSGLGIQFTVKAAQTRTYRKPVISQQDLALALQGCARMPTLAAFYHVRGDHSDYEELKRGLMLQLMRLVDRKRWPTRVQKRDGSRGHYQGELAELVLDFDANMPFFRCYPEKLALYVGVTDDIWDKVVHYWFDELHGQYEKWIATARAHVGRRWLSNEPEEAPASPKRERQSHDVQAV